MLGRESLVILAQLSQIMADKMDKPIFHMQGWINGLIDTTDCTNVRSAEIDSAVPCSTGIQTGTQNWASGWNIKLSASIILRVSPRTTPHHPCDPTPPPHPTPHFCTVRAIPHGEGSSERIQPKRHENQRIKARIGRGGKGPKIGYGNKPT